MKKVIYQKKNRDHRAFNKRVNNPCKGIAVDASSTKFANLLRVRVLVA